jgi:hypothetical protein
VALALAYLMLVAVETPSAPRHCGDICRVAELRATEMPDISGRVPEHPEKAFDNYAACLVGALEKSSISSQSSQDEIDAALQSIDDNCAAIRALGTAAFAKLVVDGGSRNTPAEIARFTDFACEMIGAGKLLPVVAQKIGPTKAKEYAEMVKPALASLMVRK